MELAGLKIVVTRPAHQAQNLCARIEAAGGRALLFPVIEIAETEDKQALTDCIKRLDEIDTAVFVSANAVNKALPQILAERELPARLKLAAVGQSTARALAAQGVQPALVPDKQFNSEGLLALDALQAHAIRGRQLVIFRGEGGRELLADTLKQRGAQVSYVNVYRRVKPRVNFSEFPWISQEENPKAAGNGVDIIIVTSGEGLENLFDLLRSPAWLLRKKLLVISERMRALAQSLGVKTPPVVASRASDAGLFEALLQWQANRAYHF